MSLISNIYLIIFLPLISSLFCYLSYKKIASCLIAILSLTTIFILLLNVVPEVVFYEKISSFVALGSFLSIILNFKIDIISLTCLLPLIFIKIISLVNCYPKIKNKTSENIFYATYLVNIFAIIGIFLSANLINLFVFLEIYSLSFLAIITIIKDKKLLKGAIDYFAISAISSLILLICFLILFFVFDSFYFEKIAKESVLIFDIQYRFFLAILLLIIGAFIAKFMPFRLYFSMLETPKIASQFLLPEIIIVKSSLVIFLIIKFYSFLLYNESYFKQNITYLILVILAVLFSIYCAITLYLQKKSRPIIIHLFLANISLVILAILLQDFHSTQALFFYILGISVGGFSAFLLINFIKNTKTNYPFLRILIFLIILMPLNLILFANIYLIYDLLQFDLYVIILIALIAVNIAQLMASLQLAQNLFIDLTKIKDSSKKLTKSFFNRYFSHSNMRYFMLLLAMITNLLLIYFAFELNNFSLKFSAYLLTNTI